MNKVKQGQSFLDKITELTGSFENALEMAILNNVSITDEVTIGQEFKATPITELRVVEYFNPKNSPATAISQAEISEISDLGIGKMAIGTSFIVR